MAIQNRRKVLAQHINAGKDRNGNPQRGWLIYERDGWSVGFVDEDWEGFDALLSLFPNAIELGTIPTTSKYYKALYAKRIRGGS